PRTRWAGALILVGAVTIAGRWRVTVMGARKIPPTECGGGGAYTTLRIDVVVLPAMSVETAVSVFWPSDNFKSHFTSVPLTVAGRSLHVTPAIPDNASVTVPVTVTVGTVRTVPFMGDIKVNAGGV